MNKEQSIKFHQPSQLEMSNQKINTMIKKIHEQQSTIGDLLAKYKDVLPDLKDENETLQKNNSNSQKHAKKGQSKSGAKKQTFNYDIYGYQKKRSSKQRYATNRKNSANNSIVQLPSISARATQKSNNKTRIKKEKYQRIYSKKGQSYSLYQTQATKQKQHYQQSSPPKKKHDTYNLSAKKHKKIKQNRKNQQISPDNREIMLKQKNQFMKRNKNEAQSTNQNDQLMYAQQDPDISFAAITNQIMKPLSVPIPLINQPKSQLQTINYMTSEKNRHLVHKNRKPNHSQSSSDEQESVPLKYYRKQLEKTYGQQCKQEINFLFFSTTAEMKDWSNQMMQLFEKHDQQLTRVHKKHKYLQTFDQSFFASQFYLVNK